MELHVKHRVRAFIPWMRRFFGGDLCSLASAAFDKDKWDNFACFIFELDMRSVGRPVWECLRLMRSVMVFFFEKVLGSNNASE